MQDVVTLRGVVFSRYKTIGEFADAIGWQRNKASRILNGVQEPDSQDIIAITQTLGINSQDLFMKIFFAPLSTLCTKGT